MRKLDEPEAPPDALVDPYRHVKGLARHSVRHELRKAPEQGLARGVPLVADPLQNGGEGLDGAAEVLGEERSGLDCEAGRLLQNAFKRELWPSCS